MRYDVADWDAAVEALRRADEVALATHVNPDGDALGSLFGASLGLRKLGAKTYPSWGSVPAEIPFSYTFLPGADDLIQPVELPETHLFVALDCAAVDRLGMLEPLVQHSTLVLNVDHHPGNEEFGTLNVVVPTASSTAELVTRLMLDAGVKFDLDIATCLYTGIVTDTGSFQYSSSTADTLRLAADLLEYGVPASDIAQEVFESAPFNYLKLVGRVLDRAVLLVERQFVYSWITLEDLRATGVRMDETEKLIDLIRSTRAAESAAMFKEQLDGTYRVSLRSKGQVSVGAIARNHGGGGHDRAAGFTTASIERGLQAVLSGLGD